MSALDQASEKITLSVTLIPSEGSVRARVIASRRGVEATAEASQSTYSDGLRVASEKATERAAASAVDMVLGAVLAIAHLMES